MKRNIRYDNKSYVDAYHAYGIFPKIHDNIYSIIANIVPDGLAGIDIGSCTGLISVRLVSQGVMSHCVGFEKNIKYIEMAVKHDGVSYIHMDICKKTIADFNESLRTAQPKVAVCRRVLPELSDVGLDFVDAFCNVLADNGVEYIAIEGRTPVKNPINKLSSIRHEQAAMSKRYKSVSEYKSCAVMRLKK